MAANGILEFQGTEKAIFRGSNSNIVIDTANSSFGVGVDTPTSNLHIVGKTSLQGDLNLVQVSNVANVTVNSNVVTEYTGPHDRPLRKYPEIILPRSAVGAEYNGYRIDRSSEHVSGPYDGVQDLFNETAVDYADTWGVPTGAYSTSTGEHSTYVTGGTTQGTGARLASNVPNGEWVSLKSPNAIKLDNIQIRSRNANEWYEQFPTDFQIWGSNDGTTWSHVKTFTGQAAANQALLHTFSVNSTIFYNRHALVVTKIPGTASTIVVSTGQAHFSISELRFNAKEEGSGSLDTTLKTVYNVPATTGTQLEVYYDAKDLTTMPSTVTDLSPNSNGGSVTGATLDTTDGIESFKFDASSSQRITSTIDTSYWGTNKLHSVSFWFKADTVAGKYNIFQIGNAAANQVSAFWISDGRADNNAGNSLNWWFYGGDSTLKTSSFSWALDTWYHIALTFDGSTKKLYVNGKHIYFSIVNTVPTANLPTGIPDSAPLVVGSTSVPGDYFDGSIANFRVYGAKTLNADQVKELYDYQKDYFLGSKSQVTLYKGHLGVGVTEPSGQLELAGDERIQEYPPGPLSDYDTYIPGHGVFKVSVSGLHQSSTQYAGWKAFNDNADGVYDAWITYDPSYNNGVQTLNKRLSSNTPLGEYIVLEFPYKVKISLAKLHERGGDTDNAPSAGIFYGSNDGVSWTELKSFSGLIYDNTADVYSDVEINATEYFYKIALVVTNIDDTTSTWMGIGELRYFGTPGPTTLDKGSLSLTRSLDVPRISRYDVDTETPRPEKLVVDFDTTVNTSPTDISGRGNHGRFFGDAQYSAADKAFKFNNTQGGIRSQTTLFDTSGKHSFAAWMKFDSFGRWYGLYGIGTNDGSASNFTIYTGTGASDAATYNTGFRLESRGGGRHQDLAWTPVLNKWVHVAVTWDGTGGLNNVNMYIDLVKLERQQLGTYESNPTSSITLPTTQAIRVGADARQFDGTGTGSNFDGQISNPKFYSEVLEFSEIKKLYNLGRTGRSMVISDTAVGIGKVPEAQLDVRGNLRVGGRGQIETLAPRYYSSMQRGTFHNVSSHIITGFDHQAEGYATPVLGWEVHINFNHHRSMATHVEIDGGYMSSAPGTHVAISEVATRKYDEDNSAFSFYSDRFYIGSDIAHAHAAVYAVIRITNSQVPGIPSAIHAGNNSTVRYHMLGHTMFVKPNIGSCLDVAIGQIRGGNNARLHGIRVATGADNITGSYTVYTYH
jgi:hypothetical protein